MDPKIERFFLQLPENKRQPAMVIREIILAVNPQIKESIKWKQLTFTFSKSNIAFIYTFPTVDYINLGFFNATQLNDENKLFEGTGEKMRHIKIMAIKDIKASQIKSLIKQAIAISDVPRMLPKA